MATDPVIRARTGIRQEMSRNLQTSSSIEIDHFACSLDLSGVESSYNENGFGAIFTALTRTCRPECVVELGSFMGYSSLHIAAALRENELPESRFFLIDLWSAYSYRRCSVDTIREHFRRNHLLSSHHHCCEFINGDAFKEAARFDPASVDLLHIDISNDGESLRTCLAEWHAKLKPGGMLLLEGGSEERDQIEWMKRYGKKPIRRFLRSAWFSERYEFSVISPFPSLTIARKLP